MNMSAVKRAIKFMREQYTHLDTPIVQDKNLHPDLFIDSNMIKDLKERLRLYLKQKGLHEAGDTEVAEPQPIMGKI